MECSCPLGHKCQSMVDGKLVNCAWYVRIDGVHPQTGEVVNENKCAIAWQPLLMVENSRQTQSVAAAVESHRNEDVAIKKTALQLIISDKKALS